MRILLVLAALTSGIALCAQTSKADRYGWEGNNSYDEKLYSEAEVAYRASLRENPEKTESLFNLGNAAYAQGRYEEAAEYFREYASRDDLDAVKKAQAWYNLGNSMYQAKDFGKAGEAYKQSLRLNPQDADAKHNLVMSLREEQKQEQQENQENQDQQDQNEEDQDQKENQDDKGDQEKKDDQGDNGDEQNEDQQQSGEGEQEQQEKGEEQQQQSQPEERNMTPEELERILQALQNDEKDVQRKINAQKTNPVKVEVEKDW